MVRKAGIGELLGLHGKITVGHRPQDDFARHAPIIQLEGFHGGVRDLSGREEFPDGRLAGRGIFPEGRFHAAWQQGDPALRDRLILSPHAAFYSPDSYIDLRRKSAETVLAYFSSGIVRNRVN